MTIATKISLFQAAGNTALGGGAIGGGLLYWLDTYSAGLGVLVVAFVALTGVIFKYLAHREMKRHHKEIEGRRFDD